MKFFRRIGKETTTTVLQTMQDVGGATVGREFEDAVAVEMARDREEKAVNETQALVVLLATELADKQNKQAMASQLRVQRADEKRKSNIEKWPVAGEMTAEQKKHFEALSVDAKAAYLALLGQRKKNLLK